MDEVLDLPLDMEIASTGELKDFLRAAMLDEYRTGKMTGTQCFDAYDKDKLWPARKEDFWEIFAAGIWYLESLRAIEAREEEDPVVREIHNSFGEMTVAEADWRDFQEAMGPSDLTPVLELLLQRRAPLVVSR